jgi:hypothetical protein
MLIDDGVSPEVLGHNFRINRKVEKEAEKEEEEEGTDMDMDMALDEPEYYRGLEFSSDEENEVNKDNKSHGKSLRKRKGKKVSKDMLLPEDNSDDDSDVYQDEEIEEDEEESIKDSIFSDVEQDSEEEIISKKRKRVEKRSTPVGSSPAAAAATKKKTREVYMAGGEKLKFEINEDGIEVPVLKKSKPSGPKKYKYSPKAGNRFNPFIVYNRMERRRIKDLYPELDNLALSRKVGEMYNLLTPVSQNEYHNG